MKTIRIPVRYKKQIARLAEKDRLCFLDSLLKLSTGEDVSLPDSICGDTIELVWEECIRMEKKNGEFDHSIIGDFVAGDPAGIPPKRKKPAEKFEPPTLKEFNAYIEECGYRVDGENIYKGYEVNNWKDSRGKQVKNWKMKLRQVWFKEENKVTRTDNIDWENLTIPEAKEMIKNDELAQLLEIKNPTLWFQAQ